MKPQVYFGIFLVLCFSSVSFGVAPTTEAPCTRQFYSGVPLPFELTFKRDDTFVIPIDLPFSTFISLKVFVDIESANSGHIKIRVNKNGNLGLRQKLVKNIGGSRSDLYSGVTFYDGAANTISELSAGGGPFAELQPQEPFSVLGTFSEGDNMNFEIRAESTGNIVHDLKIILELAGCGTTIAPPTPVPTTPVPTTPPKCSEEITLVSSLGSPSVSFADGVLRYPFNPFGHKLSRGTFVELQVFVDVDSVDSNKVEIKLERPGVLIQPMIRNSDSTANLWKGVTVSDNADDRWIDVNSFTASVSPVRAISAFYPLSPNDAFNIVFQNNDGSNDMTLNDFKLVVIFEDCESTLAPTTTMPPTTPTPTTTPIPTTTPVPTCQEDFSPIDDGSFPMSISPTENWVVFPFEAFGRRFNIGNLVEVQVYVDIDSADSSQLIVKLRRGGMTDAILRGAQNVANLFQGVYFSDDASTLVADLTTQTSPVQPVKSISDFAPFSENDIFQIMVRNFGTTVTVNDLQLRLIFTECGTLAPTTTPVPTTTPEPTTTSIPTTQTADCVRTYSDPLVPKTLDFALGVERPRFSIPQDGGVALWLNIVTDISTPQSGSLTMEISIQGDNRRVVLVDRKGGSQPDLYAGTTWSMGGARPAQSVQPTGETGPIASLIPFDSIRYGDFDSLDMYAGREVKLIVYYDGPGEVVLNEFTVTIGMSNCDPTTLAPTTMPPTTSPPTTSPPTTSPPTTSPPTTAEPTTTEPGTTEPAVTSEPPNTPNN